MNDLKSKLDDLFEAFEDDNPVNLDDHKDGIESSLKNLQSVSDNLKARSERLTETEEENLLLRETISDEILTRSILLGNVHTQKKEDLLSLPAVELIRKRIELLDEFDLKFGSMGYDPGNPSSESRMNEIADLSDFK